MRANGLLPTLLATLLLVATATTHAQSISMVWIDREAGRPCAGAGPRDVPPSSPERVAAACVLQKKDVRDSTGQVVSGVGIYVWQEQKVTRVRVYTLVPAPGAPNRWLNENGDDPKLQRPKLLADYTMALGQSKPIAEMKALGAEPMILRFSDGPRASTPARP